MTEKYVLEVDIDHETGEEHCTVLKTDGTTNMVNWIEIVSAMYTHHSILEPLVDLLNELNDENEKLKSENKGLQGKASSWKITASEQIMEQSKLMKENVQLRKENQQMKSNGLNVLHFYENKLKNSKKKDFQSIRDEIWIVKQVLYEMEVLE